MQKITCNSNAVDRDSFVLALIRERSVKQIGIGEYGTCFVSPFDPSIVIKVCRDYAYHSFVAEVLKDQSNPWFPKIKSATLHQPKDDPMYFVVEMERLRKGTAREVAGAVSLFDDNLEHLLAIGKVLALPKVQLTNLRRVRRVLHKLYKDYGPDFHRGNILFRDNQAVITDPVVAGTNNTFTIPNRVTNVNRKISK